jgi:hypothetical protein
MAAPAFAGSTSSHAVRVSALASGQVLLNGVPSDLAAIEKAFAQLQSQKGEVWYYRENANSEPTPQAMAVIELVVKYKLPITMSTRPDFSDYVGGDGVSHPRMP